MSTIADHLLAIRASKKLLQKDVAARAGITATALSAYEKGQREPSLPALIKLAEIYGVSLDWLCGLDTKQEAIESLGQATKADVIRWLTNLCESGLPVSVQASTFDYSNSPEFLDRYGSLFAVDRHNGVTIRLSGDWLNAFSAKYERLLSLYMSNDIDSEMLDAWKSKKISECAEDNANAAETIVPSEEA